MLEKAKSERDRVRAAKEGGGGGGIGDAWPASRGKKAMGTKISSTKKTEARIIRI